jgi:predicted XRE-type DNA-binding protein
MAKLTKTGSSGGVDFWEGSGNVFVDLGFPEAEERHTKLRLAFALNKVFDGSRMSQAEAARRLGINQPKVSALKNYKLNGFSVQRLMEFLTTLNYDVDIVIKKKPRSTKPGRIRVSAA